LHQELRVVCYLPPPPPAPTAFPYTTLFRSQELLGESHRPRDARRAPAARETAHGPSGLRTGRGANPRVCLSLSRAVRVTDRTRLNCRTLEGYTRGCDRSGQGL